ncbi:MULTISPECIES: hypothetical protein [unclassified Haladaptatus]|uniref:hypothetical protein n=1 Tax=unclassified Haladaptatus TaxID=2622732 RepID=UPI0023E87E8C|nr:MULTISPECIES: hypothetical protein [unclassified Haladaptatus]
MQDSSDRKSLENLRLRLRILSGAHKLEAIEYEDEWSAEQKGESLGKSVAYGKAADFVAEILSGDYESQDVNDLITDLPEEWSLNLLRYAAYSERGEEEA